MHALLLNKLILPESKNEKKYQHLLVASKIDFKCPSEDLGGI